MHYLTNKLDFLISTLIRISSCFFLLVLQVFCQRHRNLLIMNAYAYIMAFELRINV
jgi:hypothetical protein